jgi:hypothetical protein
MLGVGRKVQSGGQRTVKVSIVHEKGDVIAGAVSAVSNELQPVRSVPERWSAEACWALLFDPVVAQLARREMAWRRACRKPLAAERMKDRSQPATLKASTPLNRPAALWRAHFPF